MADVARRVTLHGELGQLFGREHRVAVNSAREAISAIAANRGRSIYKYLVSAQDKGIGFVVLIDGKAASESQIHSPSGIAHIEIAPVAHGSGGWGRIIVGVLLVVAGLYFRNQGILMAGIGMIAGGSADLMSGQRPGSALSPRTLDAAERHTEDLPSYAFTGPVNTTAPGQVHPLIYGHVIMGSRMISFGIWNKLTHKKGAIVP